MMIPTWTVPISRRSLKRQNFQQLPSKVFFSRTRTRRHILESTLPVLTRVRVSDKQKTAANQPTNRETEAILDKCLQYLNVIDSSVC